jgi:hypothetical protein
MGLSIATLQQHIQTRRVQATRVERIDLGQGIYLEAVKSVLFIANDADADDRAVCGMVEETPIGDRWLLWREWAIELTATFGRLPSAVAIDGDAQ